jgi:hypothetical protein
VARGWESKSIEAQQDDAAARRPAGPPVSREDADRRARRATLTLARARAEDDLRRATAGPHRAMLERAIAELTKQLADSET